MKVIGARLARAMSTTQVGTRGRRATFVTGFLLAAFLLLPVTNVGATSGIGWNGEGGTAAKFSITGSVAGSPYYFGSWTHGPVAVHMNWNVLDCAAFHVSASFTYSVDGGAPQTVTGDDFGATADVTVS